MKSIKYVWKNDEDVLKKSASLATLNAYLIKNQTLECNWNNNWRGKSQLHVFKYWTFLLRIATHLHYTIYSPVPAPLSSPLTSVLS